MTAPLVSFSQRWTLFQHLQFIIEKKSEALEILSSEGAMIAGVELGEPAQLQSQVAVAAEEQKSLIDRQLALIAQATREDEDETEGGTWLPQDKPARYGRLLRKLLRF